jgi:tellurite methyltransferase
MDNEPFWEKAYRDGDPDPFGSASPEIIELMSHVRPGSNILDLGCGVGRNALPLARAGMSVTAVDASRAACARLRAIAIAVEFAARLNVVEQDIRDFDFAQHYDVVIAHGVLHLLPYADRRDLLERIMSNTSPGGINVVAVFTNRLPAPPDLAEVMIGLFEEGELFDAYQHWEKILKRAYTMQDEHPGGIRHKHPVNKIIARRLSAPRLSGG